MIDVRCLLKKEKGFTILEAILSLFIVSVALLVLFSIMNEINKVDHKSKEMNYSYQLLEPYLSYYKSVDINKDNLNIFLSDVSDVDLVKEARSSFENGVPVTLRNLKLVCENKPELIKNSKGENDFIKFSISCKKNGNKINRGNPFIIIRYIN